MSYVAIINKDEEDAVQIATNNGWFDFCDSVRYFDNVDELRTLVDDGWADDEITLAANLRGIIESGDLSQDQKSIASGLLDFVEKMKPNDVITISDDTGPA